MKKKDIWQFLRFCVVGSSNAVIDFGVLNLLLWLMPTKNGWQVLGYNTLAVLLASTNSFFWNKYWTFQKKEAITQTEVLRFIVVAGSTTLLNDLILVMLSTLFPGLLTSTLIGANLIKLGAILGTLSISFFGMRLWVFLQRTQMPYTYREEIQGQYLVHISNRKEEEPWTWNDWQQRYTVCH